MDLYEDKESMIDEDLSARVTSYAHAHIEKEQVYAALPQIFTPGGKVRKNPLAEIDRSQKSLIERAMIATKLETELETNFMLYVEIDLPAGKLELSADIVSFMVNERLFVDLAMKGWKFRGK